MQEDTVALAVQASTTKPRAQRKRQSPTVRREELLAITVSCLARLGPRGTTGREICRQAGVSHGLIRHYFRNPDNLLLETYEQLCDQMLAALGATLENIEADPWAGLHRFYTAVFSQQWANADIIGAWMVFWQLVRSRDDFAAVSEAFNQKQRILLERALSLLPQPADAPPLDSTIAIISAVMDGLWIEVYLAPTRTPPERCVELCQQATRRLFLP